MPLIIAEINKCGKEILEVIYNPTNIITNRIKSGINP